jgi:adenylate cyclase, class 2
MIDHEEIEIKFLSIDPDLIIQKLERIGAKKIFEKMYRRRVFDYPDWRLDKDYSWLRLRDEGNQITLSFKKRIKPGKDGANDEGMQENEIIVSDFDQTADILLRIGLIEKSYQENKRISYILNDIEFDIDSWPQIPTYLEIEAKSWEEIDKAVKVLDLNLEDKKIFSTTQVYENYGLNLNDYQKLTFEEQILK